jgi:hypothetical protein
MSEKEGQTANMRGSKNVMQVKRGREEARM